MDDELVEEVRAVDLALPVGLEQTVQDRYGLRVKEIQIVVHNNYIIVVAMSVNENFHPVRLISSAWEGYSL